jgi:uncharacterized membrane protein (DUF485 family)
MKAEKNKEKATTKVASKKPATKKKAAKKVVAPKEKKVESKEVKAEVVAPVVAAPVAATPLVKEATPNSEVKAKSEDSDFADEEKVPEPVKEEKPAEEAKPEINLYKDDAEVAPVTPTTGKASKKEPIPTYTYDNEQLAGIEEARSGFYKIYKHENMIKWIVTSIVLVAIILGYVIPFTIPSIKSQSWAIYITLGVLVLAIALLGVYSFVSKKKLDKYMNDYFEKYYDFFNAYTFSGLGVSGLSGSVADKITPAEFGACGLYRNVYKVGSRDKINFSYHDLHLSIVDCAAQTKGQKSLVTVFVGKMLTAPNTYSGEDIVVYLKGNKRALPPTALDGMSVLEDHKDYVVYGTEGKKKALTQKVRAAISEIHTDATLVDCAIMIRSGSTYFLLGYEDTLMVLPLEKPFNPAPSEKFHEDMKKCFDVIDCLNSKVN